MPDILTSLYFPVNDVILRRVKKIRTVSAFVYAGRTWQINQEEFAMQVAGVGSFYACNGSEVDYMPAEGATKESVELYLNGSVYGAILHQRNILPLHGSSFIWNDKGVMICGDSGSGKSAVTVAFCMNGGQFLTDDVSPVVFDNGRPSVMPHSDRIKLWDDSLEQLNSDKRSLKPVRPGEEKYYFPVTNRYNRPYPLHHIIIMTSVGNDISAGLLKGPESFEAVRNEVYRWEYLAAMPKTEAGYFDKLLTITKTVSVSKVNRPVKISLEKMKLFLSGYIEHL
jgi:hypothetical protein